MVPYRGRLSLRIGRVALAVAGIGWHEFKAGVHLDGLTTLLAAYAAFSLCLLPERRHQTPWLDAVALLADLAYFGLWSRLAPQGWMPLASLSYLLTSAALLCEFTRALAFVVLAMFVSLLLPYPPSERLVWATAAVGCLAIATAFFKRHLNARMSSILRQNLVIRSNVETAREAERERIAADFHDGPLQYFISFQMRLEVIKKLLGRGKADAAAEEVRQLQDLCRSQVADLRLFSRSMRPAEDGGKVGESLGRMVDVFQRDTGITSTFSMHESPEAVVDAPPDLLQIVREALHNIHKHSGASRVAVTAEPRGQSLQITVEDNGSGFPFSGKYTLDELERLRLGPISIKRRVRLLKGDLVIESRPEQGARLEIQVPL